MSDNLSKCKEFKEQGNSFFKENNFKKAKVSYGKALAYIKGIPGSKRSVTGFEEITGASLNSAPLSEEIDKELLEIQKVLHQNIAICYLKLGSPGDALRECDNALKLDGNSWKAMLRKGQALSALGRLQSALEILNSALSLCNSDPAAVKAIRIEIEAVKRTIKQENAAANEKFRGIFGK
eukprot:gene2742-5403_t